MTDSNSTQSETRFWADEAADRVIDNDRNPVVKGGVSPSGIPHIGNFNEVLRGYFVADALREKDIEAQQVFTRDDRDPLRSIPHKLADSDGEIVELDDETRDELRQHLGKPYVDVPDPFGCCDSWADHFGSLLRDGAERLDVPITFYSNDEMYSDGEFLDATRILLSDVEKARETLSDYQRTVDDDYIPFMPICESCGRITTTPTDVDLEDENVGYVCRDTELAGKYEIEGCGHEGRASFTQGKLPWRFEWPAQWKILDVGFEPFGKDHAEGSWESGKAISRGIFDHEPPEPLVYEFFLVDGDKMSASKGNIYTVEELLEIVEPEVLKYFFALDPTKQRDFNVSEIDQLVDEFDRIEEIHYGDEDPADDKERLFAERVYPTLVSGSDSGSDSDKREASNRRIRVPYTFAAMVGVSENEDAILDVLRRSGHLPEDATHQQRDDVLERVDLARNWARRLDNDYYVEVLYHKPDVEFDNGTRAAFEDLADFIDEGHSADEIQSEIFETARRHDVGVGDFFSSGYELFLGQDSGPKLGPLLAALDREFVVERLRAA
ncbi:MAG: lysine--tRNA ligase [Halobacteria archaeon]|nr:lysine--tRNA ligase [Halobacteria archaeon]